MPGVVFVQLDGVAHGVLRRALRSGDVPTLHRWLRDGSHHLVEWETGWSSQTGVSQCGILHGSTADMPAFRWVDKTSGTVIVSNHPKCAAAIEQAHSDGNGLLAYNGSSYGNLFSGDAERSALTMSGAGRRKEGRTGAGYFGYFVRPGQATRTMVASFVEIGRERVAATRQRRRGVEPRVERGWVYALLRTFTTIITRDVSVQGVMNDMCEGRATIYVDMLGYDEVAHHSGPERVEALGVLRDLDRQLARIERVTQVDAAPVQDRRPVRPRPDPGRDVRAAHGPDAGRARRRAVRQRRRLGRRRRREGPHRVDGMAAPGPQPRRLEGGRGRRRPRRARFRQPRPDLDPRRAAPPHARGDRRPLPEADHGSRVASRRSGSCSSARRAAPRSCSAATAASTSSPVR